MEEQAQVNEEVQSLIEAWMTEVHAPDILPFKEELIQNLTTAVKKQQVYFRLFSRHIKFDIQFPLHKGFYRRKNC